MIYNVFNKKILIKRKQIFEKYFEIKEHLDFSVEINKIINDIQGDESNKNILNPPKISNLNNYLNKNWKKSSRNKNNFFQNHQKWLEEEEILEEAPKKRKINAHRPEKEFAKCSEKSKKYKTSHLMTSSSEELLFALQKLKNEGKKEAAEVP